MRVLACPICGKMPMVEALDVVGDAYKMYCKEKKPFGKKKMHIFIMGTDLERCIAEWNNAVKEYCNRESMQEFAEKSREKQVL